MYKIGCFKEFYVNFRADSVTWNPHKLLTAPQQCSTFLVRHRNVLSDAHSANAAYLFQKDKSYDIRFDTGKPTYKLYLEN